MQAQESGEAIEPIVAGWPEMDINTAYQIQLKIVEQKMLRGETVKGYKIGLTNKVIQPMFGASEPDFGHIFDTMMLKEGAHIFMNRVIQPKVEGEIAFIIRNQLKGPGVSTADVLRATAGVMPAIEIVDSRIKDWCVKIHDTVADNGSSAFVVLGSKMVPVDNLDMRLIGMIMEQDDEIAGTGAGGVVMGNPVAAVAWLANTLSRYSLCLKPGMIVLSGAIGPALPVRSASTVRVHLDRLGDVMVKFV